MDHRLPRHARQAGRRQFAAVMRGTVDSGLAEPATLACSHWLMSSSEDSILGRLVVEARHGQQAERDRLFNACRDYLNLVARTQVESWLRAKVDASDLVQETLLEAHRDFHRFQGQTEAEWLAWLRRILAHNVTDFVRHYRGTAKRQARREVPLGGPAGDDSAGRWPDPPANVETPSQQLMRADRQLAVAAALATLPDDYREVITLRNVQRLSFDEVAERMGRSRPAAQMLWARALKKLQTALGEISL